jgi:outer membrane murein-binding lipoprotein Lpp
MDQLIQSVAGLTKQVSQLANQVEELRKKVQG